MAEPAKSFERPDEVAARLRKLQLSEDVLRNAVSRGVAERRSCSPLLPPGFPGVTQWAYTHLALRELLIPSGWKPDNARNFCTIGNSRGVGVTVATGNDRTGIPGRPDPATKYPKGPGAAAAIEDNQLCLLPNLMETAPTRPLQTWYLLVATGTDGVRFELSFPSAMADDGRIATWSERIFMPPLLFDSALPPDDELLPPDIDIPIERL